MQQRQHERSPSLSPPLQLDPQRTGNAGLSYAAALNTKKTLCCFHQTDRPVEDTLLLSGDGGTRACTPRLAYLLQAALATDQPSPSHAKGRCFF